MALTGSGAVQGSWTLPKSTLFAALVVPHLTFAVPLARADLGQPGAPTPQTLGAAAEVVGTRLHSNFGYLLPDDSKCSQQFSSFDAAFPDRKVEPLGSPRKMAKPLGNASLRVINAGFGKTGTRSFFLAMCAAGLKAIHWYETCNGVSQEAIQANKDILHTYTTLKACASGAIDRTWHRCIAKEHVDVLKMRVPILLSSGIEALSDAPWEDLMPYVMDLVPQVLIAHTLRSPVEYAWRRTREYGKDTMCKDPEATGGATHWDMLGCLSGIEFVADGLTTYQRAFKKMSGEMDRNAALGVVGANYVFHNEYIMRRAAPERLHQLCVFDSDFQDSLQTVVKAASRWAVD